MGPLSSSQTAAIAGSRRMAVQNRINRLMTISKIRFKARPIGPV
jgi:hypothetical protein